MTGRTRPEPNPTRPELVEGPGPIRTALGRLWPESGKVRAGLIIAIFFVLFAGFGPLLAQYPPDATSRDLLQPPSPQHWLGTTQIGEDVFAQFVYGARVSLAVGVFAAVISKIIAILIGVIGGYVRGVTDDLLYILTAVFLVIPGMPLLIVLTGYLPNRGIQAVAVVIAITSWAGSARVLRAQTMSLRNRDFVEAARATGESRWRIIFTEVIPNELPLIASGFLFMVIGGVMAEAGLSFLGLGSLTTVSWGSMLYFAQSSQAFLYGAWWWFVPPGLAIALLGAGLALINFGIDEYANPRLRTGKRRAKATVGRRAAALDLTAASAPAGAAPMPVAEGEPVVETAREADRREFAEAAPVIRDRPGRDGAPVIEVRDLSVDYPTDHGVVHAVQGVSLTLHRSEILGLAGESGSGKTTLTNTVTRLLRAPAQVTGGSVTYHRRRGSADGTVVDVLGLSQPELRSLRWSEIAIVFQSAMNALNPVTTIRAQFDDVLRVHRPRMTRAERTELAQQMLIKVGIEPDRVYNYPHELSGGMKQRVAIALALVLDPDVIIMDEPTTALDLLVQREVLDQIMALRDEFGFAIIFTTHDLALLLEISDSIAIMRAGRLVEYGPSVEVYAEPGHPYTRSLLTSLADLGAKL
ncbi:dipeptide/oligopeptide/nickel ABC transporter permease/ATP-binding protein [Microlunatus parietis]|uniref:ABC-type dipeptide/oligopeptide/nickel transport system ATPase component/ABC-type dipeptide/oligopeptide/nickel transport system permease subunit n=1 Tax=Microlunatus parietis TaxID=682979 RepID=A0A7Y9I9G1_9ACTN|nr:dipeptide/oligopeptide/nickel ABC transporter permease/ATP-binding protein [Microlunatus parietis]NYE72411.1 ABC-type dipeptide/oligopeptide/nickel transport system ATPase component/ABC-type dipeptide/oligopeptide/nickel transport system permease subunit [Microlunatus parietis]